MKKIRLLECWCQFPADFGIFASRSAEHIASVELRVIASHQPRLHAMSRLILALISSRDCVLFVVYIPAIVSYMRYAKLLRECDSRSRRLRKQQSGEATFVCDFHLHMAPLSDFISFTVKALYVLRAASGRTTTLTLDGDVLMRRRSSALLYDVCCRRCDMRKPLVQGPAITSSDQLDNGRISLRILIFIHDLQARSKHTINLSTPISSRLTRWLQSR